jgi:serine/threonine protein phosphatase 1
MTTFDLTYAIGDIHGHFDLLLRLLDDIHRDADRRGRAARLVFLGDYVDRGPDSRSVLATVMAGPQRSGDEWVCLSGNHEAVMVEAATSEDAKAHWLRFGGGDTLTSFGGIIPGSVYAWCAALPVSFDDGERFFAHAGIRPGIALARQTRKDLLWIREEFLLSHADHGRLVVHGHTPHLQGPTIRANRINLDTGVYITRTLTGAVFADGRFDFIQVRGG